MLKEIFHFILHLRLHYQFLLLSAGYLLGGLVADQMNNTPFWLQFLNVHVLLFGGATAFNSYWDKDEGPIGGLKNPPKMTRWMRPVSLVMMTGGWLWAFQGGVVYFLIYGVSFLLFWLYSTPLARWKGDPHLSLIAIALSTGSNSVLLGTLAAGGELSPWIVFCAVGASLVLLSLYPVSQIYQEEEDKKRGDFTFARRYGTSGVKRFFVSAYFTGLLILTAGFWGVYMFPALLLFITASISGVILFKIVVTLAGEPGEYEKVMQIKLFASLSFVLFLLAANAVRYEWVGSTVLRNYF